MKDDKKSSASALARFGRDRRNRTVSEGSEWAERRPRSQRDAADSDRAPRYAKPERRASYNPNFTDDNRPMFDRSRREESRPWGDRYAYGRRSADDRTRRSDRDGQPWTGRPQHEGEHARYPFGNRKSGFGDNSRHDDKPHYGGRSRFSERGPAFGEERASKRFGGRTEDGRRYGDDRFERRDDRRTSGPAWGRRAEGRYYSDRRRQDERHPDFGSRDGCPSYPKYNPEKQIGEVRLNRFLAQSGICSRREADDFITAGLVSVNGRIVTELGTKVQPTDEVKFNDSRVQGEKKVYLVLNKPKGYVTSSDDPHADKTVMELVSGACAERIYPVGRLDKNSLGLLLFTNDGDLTRQLTHPSYRKKKIYQVTLDKPLTRADMDRLAEGITLEDGEIHADEISYVKENRQEVGVEIHSGRNRIVRRMFEFLGYTVTKLDRVYYAGLTKKNLNRGRWRFLTDQEVARLRSGQYE